MSVRERDVRLLLTGDATTRDDAGTPAGVGLRLAALALVVVVSLGAGPGGQIERPLPFVPGLPADVTTAGTILAAEDRRDPGPELVELAAAPDPATRARVALALGRIGRSRSVPALVRLLEDEDERVRGTAAFALGRIGYDLPEPGAVPDEARDTATRALEARLDDVPEVARQALWSLGQAAGAGALGAVRGVLARHADAATTAGSGELVAALDAVWRLPGAEVDEVARFAGAADPTVRQAVAHALRRLDRPAGQPILAKLLDDPVPEVRAVAARGLRDAPANVAEARAPELLLDRDWRVVAEALAWLQAAWATEGAADGEVVGAVMRASLGRDVHQRRLAVAALGEVADAWPAARDRVLQALEDDEASVRATALDTLAGMGVDAAARLLDVVRSRYGIVAGAEGGGTGDIDFLENLSTVESTALIRFLAATGEPAALQRVERAAHAGRPAERAAALRSLAATAPRRGLELSADVLEGEAPPVLQAVAAEIVEGAAVRGELRSGPMDRPTWGRLLWEAQRRLAGAGLIEPRLLALQALEEVAPELLRDRAGVLVEDPERVVRLWVVRGPLSPPGAAAGVEERARALEAALAPAQTGRSPADYERIAARTLELQARPPLATVDTPRGSFDMELRADWAPLTVDALVGWIDRGFYDGLTFHRVVADFVVQGGDPTATGYGGAPATLRSEDSPIPYGTGVMGLALAGRDTGGSQWFVTHAPQPHLTGLYPVVGRIVSGQRVVDRLQPGDPMEIDLDS